MTRKEKVIYLAGVFDGDGCIGLYNTRTKHETRSPQYQAILRVTQKCPLSVEVFLDVFGGKIYSYKDVGPGKPGPYFSWRVTDKSALLALRELRPYLREKRAQADILLEFDNVRKKQRSKNRNKPLTPEMLQIRESYIGKLKEQKHLTWDLNHFNLKGVSKCM